MFFLYSELIIGERKLHYLLRFKNIIIKTTIDLEKIGWFCRLFPLNIYMDSDIIEQEKVIIPKLYNFEIKKFLLYNFDLQNKNILSLCCFNKKLAQRAITIHKIFSFSFLEQTLTKLYANGLNISRIMPYTCWNMNSALSSSEDYQYLIEKSIDDKVCHTFIIENDIEFMRYTEVSANLTDDLNKSMQYIQSQYGIYKKQIKIVNQYNAPFNIARVKEKLHTAQPYYKKLVILLNLDKRNRFNSIINKLKILEICMGLIIIYQLVKWNVS